MKTINKLWIKRLTEEKMSSEPENAAASDMYKGHNFYEPEDENLSHAGEIVNHVEFTNFLKSLGFNQTKHNVITDGWDDFHSVHYRLTQDSELKTITVRNYFHINLLTVNGIQPKNGVANILATYSLFIYSKKRLKTERIFTATIPPINLESPYLHTSIKDFVLGVISLMRQITASTPKEKVAASVEKINELFLAVDFD